MIGMKKDEPTTPNKDLRSTVLELNHWLVYGLLATLVSPTALSQPHAYI